MYQVLYRKYRPRFFADVIGQPQVTVTLKNELKSGRIAHAYLFTGTRGTGKTTCAKILAKAVNCLNPQDGDPCGECEVCRGLDDGSIMDVMEIDAASNNGVDSIRSLIEEAAFTPANTRYRVYIIDEVHMLSVAAFNALLKTLEEPPEHVIFILATTEVHKLLPTILSRCQRFDFRRIAPEDIADRLVYVAQQEQTEIDRDAALQIARIADGGMRDALSIFDQCLSRGSHVTMEIVRETTGIADQSYLLALADAVFRQDSAGALSVIASLYQGSKDMARLCEEMAEYFRGLMIIKTTRSPAQILSLPESQLEAMTPQATGMPLSMILHALDTFEDCLNRMRFGHARTEMEMAFVRLCSPELDTGSPALLRRLEALENRAPQQAAPASAKSKKTREDFPSDSYDSVDPAEEPEQPDGSKMQAAETAPKEAGRSAQPRRSIEELSCDAQPFDHWEEILRLIKSYSSSVAAAFEGSAAYVNGDYLLIDAPQFAFDLLKRPSQRDRIRDSVRQVTGQVYRLGPYKKPGGESGVSDDPLDELEKRAQEAGFLAESDD